MTKLDKRKLEMFDIDIEENNNTELEDLYDGANIVGTLKITKINWQGMYEDQKTKFEQQQKLNQTLRDPEDGLNIDSVLRQVGLIKDLVINSEEVVKDRKEQRQWVDTVLGLKGM